MPRDINNIVTDFNNENLNITSSYLSSLKKYNDSRESMVKAGIAVSTIILIISFFEIFLMIRASFLSRIKEVGIYRAIGVKKSDIYKMFFGEIFAITTVACIPGVLFMSYCLSNLSTISYFSQNYIAADAASASHPDRNPSASISDPVSNSYDYPHRRIHQP